MKETQQDRDDFIDQAIAQLEKWRGTEFEFTYSWGGGVVPGSPGEYAHDLKLSIHSFSNSKS